MSLSQTQALLSEDRYGQLQQALQREAEVSISAQTLNTSRGRKPARPSKEKQAKETKRRATSKKPKATKSRSTSTIVVIDDDNNGSGVKRSSAAQRGRDDKCVPISSDGLCTESSHFFQIESTSRDVKAIDGEVSTSAGRRRRSWTPLEDAGAVKSTVMTLDLEDDSQLSAHTASFRQGIRDFEYSAPKADNLRRSPSLPQASRRAEPRRTKIDLVNVPRLSHDGGSRKNSKPKGTSVGTATITEISMAVYNAETAISARDVIESRKRRTASPIKLKADSKRRKSKEKEGSKESGPEVLSPQAAQQKLNELDFCFGTFSQLAYSSVPRSRTASPEPVLQSIEGSQESTSTIKDDGRLWTASTRLNGGLIGDVYAANQRSKAQKASIDSAAQANGTLKGSAKSETASDAVKTAPPVAETDVNMLDDIVSIGSGPSNTLSSHASPSKKAPRADKTPMMPDFSKHTDANLAREIKAYGFKPIRSRAKLIALLESCWESKNRLPLRSRCGGDNVPTSPVKETAKLVREAQLSTPKSRASVPQAQRTAPAAPMPTSEVIEIPDSEEDSDSTPIAITRTSTGQISSLAPPPPILQPRDKQIDTVKEVEDLEKLITKAVRASPFFHKILVYDPLVIEELGLWLNTNGLRTVCDYDGEVGPGELISWCRAQSVCWIYEKKRWHRERG